LTQVTLGIPLEVVPNDVSAYEILGQPESSRYPDELNLNGPFYCSREALVRFRKRGGGFIVNISSLAGKNAICTVEFAKAQREEGRPNRDATLAACRLRLRPILMTSFAFILGVVPLMLSEGAGSEMRKTLGTAVFAGMLGVTLFGIFLTPVFFFVIQWVKDRRGHGVPENGNNGAIGPVRLDGEIMPAGH